MKDAPRRVPCPQHPCSPSYAGSPAVQGGCMPCPVHGVASRDSDIYHSGEYHHDPLYFDPRRRVTVQSPEGRAKQQHQTGKSKQGKLYDSHIHERRLRDQGSLEHSFARDPSGTTHGQQPPKPVGPTRMPLPAFAGQQAGTSKEKAGTSARRPSAPYPTPKDPPVPAPKSSKHQVRAAVQAVPSVAALPRTRVPSVPAANQAQGRAKPVAAAPRKEASPVDERAIEKNRKARASYPRPESSHSSQIRPRKSTKKHKKKKKHNKDAIVVSTPTGPFSPGTKAVMKSQKALKKAQELWQYSQLVGTFCLIFEIVGTIAILLVRNILAHPQASYRRPCLYMCNPRQVGGGDNFAYYTVARTLISFLKSGSSSPSAAEEPGTKMHYGADYGDQDPPFVPTRILHDGEGNNDRPERL
ncbi:hypothetical protein MTO96_002061 [Rhipicephalus appendiculatus]